MVRPVNKRTQPGDLAEYTPKMILHRLRRQRGSSKGDAQT
jgi:hypothetical protein